MVKLKLFLTILLIWLQYSLWFGKNCLRDYINISNDIIAQQTINTKLKTRNNQLIIEINNLNNSLEVIEERARNELGMIRPDETFYRLVPNISEHN